MNYDLSKKLKQSCDFLTVVGYYTNKAEEMDSEISTHEKKYEELIRNSKGRFAISMSIIILLAIYALFLRWVNSVTENPSDYSDFIIIWSCVAFVALIFILVENIKCHRSKIKACKYKQDILEPTILKNNSLKNNIEVELEQFNMKNYQNCLSFIPKDYWGQPIFELYKIVSQGRADTLKEAINIYEQEKLLKQIKKTQKQILNAQEEYYENLSEELTQSNREMNMHLDGIENLLAYNTYLNKRRNN